MDEGERAATDAAANVVRNLLRFKRFDSMSLSPTRSLGISSQRVKPGHARLWVMLFRYSQSRSAVSKWNTRRPLFSLLGLRPHFVGRHSSAIPTSIRHSCIPKGRSVRRWPRSNPARTRQTEWSRLACTLWLGQLEMARSHGHRLRFPDCGNYKLKAMISCGGGLLGRASR
jgi:hypothetical protein